MLTPLIGMVLVLADVHPLAHYTSATNVLSSPQVIYALATGELDNEHPGLELAVLLGDGSVLLVRPGASSTTWSSESISLPTDAVDHMSFRPTIEIGDVHSAYPGNEIVIEAGLLVTCIFRDPQLGWGQETIWDQTMAGALTWGARIGDLDPDRPGMEVYKTWEGFADSGFGSILREVDNQWTDEIIYVGPVCMDSAIADLDSSVPGDEIINVSEVGPAFQITRPVDGLNSSAFTKRDHAGLDPWPRVTIWDSIAYVGWVSKIADIDRDTHGLEVAYGSRVTPSIMLSRPTDTDQHAFEVLYTSPAIASQPNMWDITVGQVIVASPHLEIAGVDESGQAYLVTKLRDGWTGGPIHQADDALYAVTTGDFLPDRPGNEILVAGEEGLVTLLSPETPGASYGDLNGDDLVNLSDWDILESCLGGPSNNVEQPGCAVLTKEYADNDHDGDLDLADFAVFANALGSGL